MLNGESKNWIRFLAAIDGFQATYGRWPTRVRVFSFFIEELKSKLNEPSFSRLSSMVQLIGDGSPYIAEDENGNSYNYGEEGFSKIRSDVSANVWLGVQPDYFD